MSGNAVHASNGFYQDSDERLKIFKDSINVNLTDLSKLKKCYYEFKNDKTKQTHIGVSAQEIEKLFPEIVSINADGYLSVDYAQLSVIALKAIDMLYDEINILKDRINLLEDNLNNK